MLSKGQEEEQQYKEASPLMVRHPSKSGLTKPYSIFAGWGTYDQEILVDEATLTRVAKQIEARQSPHEMLGEWQATSICSNDILSSCFYTIGLVTSYAGKLAPVCLFLVGLILYVFRSIYGECISSYPMNGGSYNLLINTTSKSVAATAAILSVIAYIATGVVSAVTACNYLHAVLPDIVDVPIASCMLLMVFALVVTSGLRESASVAMVISIIHVGTLLLVLSLGLLYVLCNDLGELPANLNLPFPDINSAGADIPGSLGTALLFGFAGGMLGVSGFETSAQYIESQKPGVFLQTLKNMQLGVTFFNPLLSLLSISVLPLGEVVGYSETVLERVSHVMGDWLQTALGLSSKYVNLGRSLRIWVSFDAFVVLSGAVLTAYVGIDGLIYTMSMDGCLPQFLLKKNTWRNTNHYIIFTYLLLAISQVLLMEGDVDALAGVYSFAFLSVMGIFSIGCMLLKIKRADLPRDVVAPWWHVICGFFAIVLAFVANLQSKPVYLVYFSFYFVGVGLVTFIMFERVQLLKLLLYFGPSWIHAPLKNYLRNVRSDEVVFFCKKPDLYMLNKALLYVRSNETTADSVLIVHCYDDSVVERDVSREFRRFVELVDRMYPSIKVSLLKVKAPFSPALVEFLSSLLDVPKNMMFIACPSAEFRHRIDKLGGLRVITH